MIRTFAAADIGSNTAHLLVGATDSELVMRIDNFNEWIPLGEVVTLNRKIPKDIVSQLVDTVREFKRIASGRQCEGLYVFATEGMRVAENHEAVLKKIRSETSVEVEIISPQREAELSLRGMLLDTRHYGVDMMFEVGGGSAQIGRVLRNNLVESESMPMGTGRLIAQFGMRNPCPDYALVAAENYIDAMLEKSSVLGPAKMAVASGGVARGLWRALHPDSEKVLTMEEIDYVIWSASRLPVERIAVRFGVKQKRAGTLLTGAVIYRALMRKFGVREIVVSEFGIREGAILEMAAGKIKGARP